MTVCWLVVNTLLGVGMQVVAEAVALGSTLDLPRDLSSTHWPRLLSSLRLISESWLAPKGATTRHSSRRATAHAENLPLAGRSLKWRMSV